MIEGAPFRIVGQDRHAANCPDLLRAVRETSGATLQTALVHVPDQDMGNLRREKWETPVTMPRSPIARTLGCGYTSAANEKSTKA